MQIYRQRQNRIPTPLKVLLVLVIVLGASFSLAWVWQTTEQAVLQEEAQAAQSSAPAESAPEPVPAVVSEPDSASLEASGVARVEQPQPSEAEEESAAPDNPQFPYAVPATEAVTDTYFDDAIFLGDSITTGIPLYHIADNAAVVAFQGINPMNINSHPCIDLNKDGIRLTVLDAARAYAPRSKVYIMLGGNGLGFDLQTFVAGYKQFLDSVRTVFPDATIYLQSMTPVVEGYVNEFDPELDNDKINTYNYAIMELAQQEGVHYLDVASALKDDRGYLPLEASPTDGMHFSPEYYLKWFQYLKTHTVEASNP